MWTLESRNTHKTHTHIHARRQTQMHARTQTHAHRHNYTHTDTIIYTQTHTRTHTHAHTRAHTQIHTHAHIHRSVFGDVFTVLQTAIDHHVQVGGVSIEQQQRITLCVHVLYPLMCQYAVFSFSDRIYGMVTLWYVPVLYGRRVWFKSYKYG